MNVVALEPLKRLQRDLTHISCSSATNGLGLKVMGSKVKVTRYFPRMHFYRATACNATHGIAVRILSVRPSVRQMRVL